MAEEFKHGAPTPQGQNRGPREAGSGLRGAENRADQGPQVECGEFETLLTDALEDQLTGARKNAFDAHRRACAVCGPMFSEVEAGRHWLRSLEPVEPPVHLVHNILAATTGVISTRHVPSAIAPPTGFGARVRGWWDSWLAPVTAFARQPRFVMSFGMIFFSFSLALSVAGVRVSDVAKIDLRPAALRHAYNEAQIRVVKYYDNIRFVYEIESKVRQLRESATPVEPSPQPKRENRNNKDTSGQPDQNQDRNYSREQSQTVLAGLTAGSYQLRARGPQIARFWLDGVRATSFELTPACSRLAARGSEFKPADALLAQSSKLVARGYRRYV